MMDTNPRAKQATAAAALACCIAAPCEGMRQYVYKDPVGIPTYCFGETRNPVLGKRYSIDECKGLLTVRMQEAVDQVARCAPSAPVSVLAAFGSAVYNLGPTLACDPTRSTAARLLSAGQWPQACEQLPRWNKATTPGGFLITLPGLTKRRLVERDECLKFDDAPATQETPNA
jgi:lysozyme